MPSCAEPAHPALRAELYLGGDVNDADWRGFLDSDVTPRFPDGLTVLAADGQWRAPGTSRVIREHSRVLLIVIPRSPAASTALDAVAEAYKRRFAQQSVGIVTTASCAAF